MADKTVDPFEQLAQHYRQASAPTDAAPPSVSTGDPFEQLAQHYRTPPAPTALAAPPPPQSRVRDPFSDLADYYTKFPSSTAPSFPKPPVSTPVPTEDAYSPTRFLGAESLKPRTAAPDPFEQLAQHYRTTPAATADVTPSQPTDPFEQLAQHYRGQPSATAAEATGTAPAREDDETPWYLRPLSTTVLGIPEYRPGAGGFERGVEKFVSGLTSPLSVALFIVTGGTASLAEGAAASFVESRLAPQAAALVVRSAKIVSELANAGFTVQQIHDVAKAVPQFADAIKAGETDRAWELGTQALLGAGFAALSASHLVRKMGVGKTGWIGDKETVGEYQNHVEIHNVIAQQFERANADLIKNKPMDMAARLYHEANEDPITLQSWRQEILQDKNIKPTIRAKYDEIFKLAQQLPDAVKKVSQDVRTEYATDWAELQNLGKVAPKAPPRSNYAGQHQYVPDDEGASNLRPVGRFTKTPGFLKKRSFDTMVEALKAGFEPTDTGLAAARADYIRNFGVMKGATEAEKFLLKTASQDGRLMGVDPAKVRLLDVGKGKKSVILIDPTKVNESAIPPERIFDKKGRTAADAGFDKTGKHYMDVSDYREGPNLFNRHRVTGATTVQGEDVSIYERKNVLIHPDNFDAIKTAFDNDSWVKKTPILGQVLKVATQAKKSLLSVSPFHWSTEYARGLQMGLTPLELAKLPPLTPERLAVQVGTRHGLSLLGDQAKSAFREGLSSEGSWLSNKVREVPKVGSVLASIVEGGSDKLFGDYLPRLKAAAFEKIVGQLEKRHGNWAPEEIYKSASNITNAAFGGINWRRLGVSASSQDLLRLVMLAPDFTGSQLLFGKAGMEAGGSIVWQSMARIAVYNFLLAQSLNLLINGETHPEHPFSVVSPDGKKTFSMRTMPEDIWHGLTDPRGFLYNRLNPLTVRTGIEAITARDMQGKDADIMHQTKDLLRNVTPMSLQNLVPGFRREGESYWESGGRALGVSPQQDRTEAERLTAQLAANRSTIAPGDPDSLARHRQILQIEDALLQDKKDGKLDGDRVAKLVQGLTPHEIQTIKQTLKYDTNLQVRFERLPAADAIKVFQIATDKERAMLTAQMLQKYKRYAQSLKTRLEPGQRPEDDPTFRRLQNLVIKIQSAPQK